MNHKEIQLTQNKVALVDECDFLELSKVNWCANKKGSNKKSYFYAVRNIYPESYTKPVLIYMHRVIMGDVQDGMVVDHINGNTLDNRRSNLRVVDRLTNYRNQHE